MKSKLSVILFGAVFFCLSSMAISAATITVNTLTDENNTNGAACSLREAINNANDDNTTNGLGCVAGSGTDNIVISVNGTITPTVVLPTISTSMSITGNGAGSLTINGNNAFRVFVISGGTVSINNLTVSNGFNSVQGGGIFNTGTSVTTLSGITLTNSGSGQGGGLQNDAVMIINNSTILNNQATNFGGGITNFGTLTVSGSILSGNVSPSDSGGIGNNGDLTVTDSTFTGNTSPSFGSAINHSGNGTLSVTRSTMIGNLDSPAISVDSSAVSTISNTTFFNNGETAISANSLLNLTNCTISGNRSGAITTSGGASVTLINNIVAGNTNAAGTAQLDIPSSGGINTANSFNNLIGTGGAGGLTNGVNGNQTNVAFANVRLLPLGSYGGSVQTMPIRTNSPARNAGRNTGAPATDARGYNRPQATMVDIGAFEIQTNSIVTNTANTGAGSLRDVVAAVPANEIVQFETPLFDTAQTISLSAGQITINKNITINGNGANIFNVRNTAAVGASSRVFNILTGNTVVLNGMSISGGNVTDSGGGIQQAGNTNLTLNGCILDINTAAVDGGGIRSTGTLTILNSAITNNTANGTGGLHGGGIDYSGGSLTITNSTISGNSSLGGNTNGGGIWTNNNTVITNSTITNNTVSGTNSGSGIYQTGAILTTVRNSIIAGNTNNTTFPDVFGGYTSGGFNIVGNRGSATGFTQPTDQTGTSPLFENAEGKSLAPAVVLDPGLTGIGLNGGTVPAHALLNDSPAIDRGNSFGATTDARGLLRPLDLPGFTNAAGGDGADIGAYELQAVPTSANVSVAGRVLTANGAGLTNAIVYLTDSRGVSRTVKTGSFGNYVFEELTSGETYTISVVSRRFQFAPQIITVNESVIDFNFTAIE